LSAVSAAAIRAQLSAAENAVLTDDDFAPGAATEEVRRRTRPSVGGLVSDRVRAYVHVATVARTIGTRTLVREKQTRMAGMAVAAWAIPLALLYALGWSIGWVRRGFQPATSTK
jgi:hypothetical protein